MNWKCHDMLCAIPVCVSMLLTTHLVSAAPTLDADGNGLYDDTERKTLVETFQKACPELTGKFDADDDGKVTIQEQTAGRHPLSMTVGKGVLQSGVQIPWGIDIFPEWISTACFQEDAPQGAVANQPSRGIRPKEVTQTDQDMMPVKHLAGSGVEFAANSGQFLSMPGERDARWNYRWCVFTFRINAQTGKDDRTVLLDLNAGNGSGKSSPKIWYDKKSGLHIQYVGLNKGGLDKRIMTTRDLHTDGRTWNVVVCGIRYGQMYAAVNGVDLVTDAKQPDRFVSDMAYDVTTNLGSTSKGNMAWAYDALVLGLTEPSEAMVRKMTGWAAHRLGFAEQLPSGHPYRYKRPVVDHEDFPYRYVHDNDKWLEWGASIKKNDRRINAGKPPVKVSGFERVFYDDFRAKRVTDSNSGAGDLWMAPGFNTAVGVDAPLVAASKKPDVYPYDAQDQKQTLSLVLQGNRWRGSAFYTVNDMGHGYTWDGPKIFRIRCMFPKLAKDEIAGGLFPAFWSYGIEWLFWRTSNRIENDWFEFDGQNPRWLNGVSTHFHYAHINNIFAMNPKSYQRFKVYGKELTEENSKIPGGLYFWDGLYHTWEFVIDDTMFYINITIPDENGNDQWVEVCRSLAAPTYFERQDLQLDYALKAKHGTPKDGARQDFVVDFVEVLQKTSQINQVPAPFKSRPQLMGMPTFTDNRTQCRVDIESVKDLRYYWFIDGYPLTYGPDNTIQTTPEMAGKTLRCMVKAVGARDMPEAWSDTIKIVSAPQH